MVGHNLFTNNNTPRDNDLAREQPDRRTYQAIKKNPLSHIVVYISIVSLKAFYIIQC